MRIVTTFFKPELEILTLLKGFFGYLKNQNIIRVPLLNLNNSISKSNKRELEKKVESLACALHLNLVSTWQRQPALPHLVG